MLTEDDERKPSGFIMTDYDKVTGLFAELGIPFFIERVDRDGKEVCNVTLVANGRRSWGNDVKVEGYESFYTVFEFDDSGKFNAVGIWE